MKIDPFNKKIYCNPRVGSNVEGGGEFIVDYDYLVIAVGARVNTFNTPGVAENCHFLKVVLIVRIIYMFPFLQIKFVTNLGLAFIHKFHYIFVCFETFRNMLCL